MQNTGWIHHPKSLVQSFLIQNQSDPLPEKQPTSDIRRMRVHPVNALLVLFLSASGWVLYAQADMYSGKSGSVHFTSDAPLEMIEAKSEQLSGAINPKTYGVAFSVRLSSFHGFNSAVQREHFMENYMEVSKYPVATLTGKIIEQIDFSKNGKYDVRVKGNLNIHGVSTERIIPGSLTINSDTLIIRAAFSVPLQEHAINIPKLLSQKIAETIYVQIDMVLQKG